MARRGEARDRRGSPRGSSVLGRLPRRPAARVQPGRPRLSGRRARGRHPARRADRGGRSDPVFAGLPEEVLTLQWHGDTFDLPDGAVLLAGSGAYPNQAFRFGTAAYGVQFHLEVSPELAREWAEVPAYAEALERMLGPGALDRLIDGLDAEADAMLGHGRLLFERWLEVTASSAAASKPPKPGLARRRHTARSRVYRTVAESAQHLQRQCEPEVMAREDVGVGAVLGARVRVGPGLVLHRPAEGAAREADRALRAGAPREREALRRRAALPAPQPRAARRARLPRAHGARGVRRPGREPRRLLDGLRDDRPLRLRVHGHVLRHARRRGQRDHAQADPGADRPVHPAARAPARSARSPTRTPRRARTSGTRSRPARSA